MEKKCSTLVPLLPLIFELFRQSRDLDANDLIISNDDIYEEEAKYAIQQLFDIYSTQKDSAEVLMVKHCVELLSPDMVTSYVVIVSKSVTMILSQAQPGLFSAPVVANLLKSYVKNKKEVENIPKRCGSILGAILDEMPVRYYQIFGTLCAYIRDYATDKAAVCDFLAPRIFRNPPEKHKEYVNDLFMLLVNNAEITFGTLGRSSMFCNN